MGSTDFQLCNEKQGILSCIPKISQRIIFVYTSAITNGKKKILDKQIWWGHITISAQQKQTVQNMKTKNEATP